MTKEHKPPKNHPISKGTYNLTVKGTEGYLFEEDLLSIEEAVSTRKELISLGHKSTIYCIVKPKVVYKGMKSTY